MNGFSETQADRDELSVVYRNLRMCQSERDEILNREANAKQSVVLLQAHAQMLVAALTITRDLIESTLAHVSHGGPTRGDAERALKVANAALSKVSK